MFHVREFREFRRWLQIVPYLPAEGDIESVEKPKPAVWESRREAERWLKSSGLDGVIVECQGTRCPIEECRATWQSAENT